MLVACLVVLTACGGGGSSSPSPTPPTPPPPAGPPVPPNPSPTPGSGTITPAAGWTDEGVRVSSQSAGFPGAILADVTVFRLNDGRWRFIFEAGGAFRSAISPDGLAVEMEPGTRVPPSGPSGPIHPRVIRLDDGRVRMFYAAGRVPDEGIYSAISTDEGLTFTLEPGVRLTASAAGFERIGGVGVVRSRDGRWRMYTSDRATQPVPGEPSPVTRIVSATSADMLTWTMDPGVRVGAGAVLEGPSEHPSAIANPDGSISLFYHARPQRPDERIRIDGNPGIMVATSADGLSFTTEQFIVRKGADFLGDPDVVRLPDGGLRVYYGLGGNEGGEIRSVRRAAPTASALTAIDQTARAGGSHPDSIRALSDEVLDRLSPLHIPRNHSLRERLSRAEENFRRGSHHAISESALVDAMNGVASAAGGPTPFVVVEDFRAHRTGAQIQLPYLLALTHPQRGEPASTAAGMSPLEGLTYCLSLLKDRLEAVDPGIGWTAYRMWLERELADENSQTSWSAHDLLTAVGVRR
jgi:hypothetical protein